MARRPECVLYEEAGEPGFDFEALRLPFEPEMGLIPHFGHSRGHCGVSTRTGKSWHFHIGDASPR